MTDLMSHQSLIALALFFIGVLVLEGLLYGEELLEVTHDQIGIDVAPTPPKDAWNVFGWFFFFVSLIGYVVLLLSNCMTLPIDEIPLLVRIIILTPIWIIVIIMLYNFFTKLIASIGQIIPFTIVLIGDIKNEKQKKK